MQKVIRCYEKAMNISKDYNKDYSTSISYGIVELKEDNILTTKQLIDLADSNMYDFKKARKKNR